MRRVYVAVGAMRLAIAPALALESEPNRHDPSTAV